MKVNQAHLTYCTNIHPGEDWETHFAALKQNFPEIKKSVSPDAPMGIGLRLSNQASIEILMGDNMQQFKQWLFEQDAYVFTMNGFPYGGFHHTVVKDQVHAPDWTTTERLAYMLRLFHILTALVPDGMDGGISTSPLSYKHWFDTGNEMHQAVVAATHNILAVAGELNNIYEQTGTLLHLDIEPEPDGVLETGREFIDWYQHILLPEGIAYFAQKHAMNAADAEALIKRHIALCYDVCHFAIGYEAHAEVVSELTSLGINTGKIQISAALKASFKEADPQPVYDEFSKFDEPTYLHQVIACLPNGELARYPDLTDALLLKDDAREWRAHFHVPVFTADFGLLQSTREDIEDVLALWKNNPFTNHLEVETYTWTVLPEGLKLPMAQSISRELNWVKGILN